MGAKVGKRVYWPGSGIYCPDPELLEIGDDVVFGSRSELFTSDNIGSGKITVGHGAMIADRCVLLPGSHVGRRTVMGSGALGKRGGTYPDGSTWMGNDGGEAAMYVVPYHLFGAKSNFLHQVLQGLGCRVRSGHHHAFRQGILQAASQVLGHPLPYSCRHQPRRLCRLRCLLVHSRRLRRPDFAPVQDTSAEPSSIRCNLVPSWRDVRSHRHVLHHCRVPAVLDRGCMGSWHQVVDHWTAARR